jgi:putative MFS transporter
MSERTTVSDAVDDLVVGQFHRRLLVITGCVLSFTAVEVLSISFVLPSLIDTWNLSGLAAGVLGSAALVGIMLGSWFGGWYADRFGRVSGLQLSVLCYSLFAGLTALSVGLYSAAVLRFLTGLGVGWATTTAVSYLTEHLPTRNRGKYVVYFEAFWPVGTVLIVGLAWLVLDIVPTDGAIYGIEAWRFVFVGAMFPALLIPVIRRLDETPYYLAATDRIEEANGRIRAIAGETDSDVVTITGTRDDRGSTSFRRLFSPGLRWRTLLASLVWFGINFGFYGVFIWLPDTLEAANLGGSIYEQLFLVAIAQLPGILSAAYLIDRVGRKITIGSYLLLAGVFTFAFATELGEFSLPLSPNAIHPLLSLFLASFFLIGAWGPMLAYTSELFPTEVRGLGFGFVNGMGKIASISGPILAGLLVEFGYFTALTPFAVGLVVGGALVLLFGVETMNRSLK